MRPGITQISMVSIPLLAYLAIRAQGPSEGSSIANLKVTATTPTQAIITFDKPGPLDATIVISDSKTYSPLLNDVNPILFPGSNLSSRAGSVLAGNHVTFVAGKRSADVARDGIRYSRAHAALTTYYVRVSYPGSAPQTAQYTTQNIPFGVGYLEPQPGDPANPGVEAFPSLSHGDRTQTVIDPQTGVRIKRLTLSSDGPVRGADAAGVQANGADWKGAGFPATVAGSTQKLLLYVPDRSSAHNGANAQLGVGWVQPGMSAYGQQNNASFGAFQLTINAGVNLGGSLPAAVEDREIEACITIDHVHCYQTSQIFEKTLSTKSAQYVFGGNGGSGMKMTTDLWQSSDLDAVPAWFEEARRMGAVTCDGSKNVTLTGGDPFGLHWVAGSHINIAGVEYLVAAPTNGQILTLETGCPAAANVPYSAMNFGALLWKKTASSDRVSIASASINYRVDTYGKQFLGGGPRSVNPTPIPGPGGELGHMTFVGEAQTIYWIGADSGNVYLMDTPQGQLTTGQPYGCGANAGIYDTESGDSFFCSMNGRFFVFKYFGNFLTHPEFQPFQEMTVCSGNPPYKASQPCFERKVVTDDLGSLLVSFTSGQPLPFDRSAFANAFMYQTGSDAAGGMIFHAWEGVGNFQIAWIFVFNPHATANADGGTSSGAPGNHGCVGGGKPGCIMAATPGWQGAHHSWCTWKDGGSPAAGWTGSAILALSTNPNETHVGVGPFFTKMVDGTADKSVNAISKELSSFTACPANKFGAPTTGQPQCQQITVAGEPQSPLVAPGARGIAQPGDWISLGPQGLSLYLNDNQFREKDMILAKRPGSAPGTFVYTIWRGINFQPPIATYAGSNFVASGSLPFVNFTCNAAYAPDNQGGYVWYWNWSKDPHGSDTTGKYLAIDPYTYNGHGGSDGLGSYITYGVGTLALVKHLYPNFQAYSYKAMNPNETFAQELARAPNSFLALGGSFNGNSSGVTTLSDDHFQSHAGLFNMGRAADDQRRLAWDGRPYLGGGASGTIKTNGDCPATKVAGSLWKFAAACMPGIDLPYQKTYPTAAFAGDRPMVNVSGPGSAIAQDSSANFTYCIAAKPGECYSGSTLGETYFNVPGLLMPYCYNAAQNGTLPDGVLDICIGGSPAVRDGFAQFQTQSTDTKGSGVRVLTRFTGTRHLSPFMSPQGLTPNGKWMQFESQLVNGGGNGKQILMAQAPPTPTPDGINRLLFEPIPVAIGRRANSTAYVRFGYAENGPVTDFWCTTRREPCAATGTATTFPAANPFQMEKTEVFQPVDVSSGDVTIQIPGIPLRVLYYEIVYKDKTSSSLTVMPPGVAAAP